MYPYQIAEREQETIVRKTMTFLAATLLAVAVAGGAVAAQLTIVALGASNTAGKGVGTSQAFPAQLEAMLKQRGIDARVINDGVSGATTEDMMGRLGSVLQQHPQVVIFQPGGNDLTHGGTRETRGANIKQIVGQLRAQGIKVFVVNPPKGFPPDAIQRDGVHLTEQGHVMLAARLVKRVTGAAEAEAE